MSNPCLKKISFYLAPFCLPGERASFKIGLAKAGCAEHYETAQVVRILSGRVGMGSYLLSNRRHSQREIWLCSSCAGITLLMVDSSKVLV